jgi:hypothetical protein
MWWHSKFGSLLCKIRWEKYPRAFEKVVEGGEIYNFHIQHLVHFCSKIGRKTCSKWPSMKQMRRNRAASRHRRAGAPVCTAPSPPATLGVWAACRPRSRAFPRRRVPRGRLWSFCTPRGAPTLAGHASRHGPPVRPPFVRPRAPKTPLSVHRSLVGARIDYKTVAAPYSSCAGPPQLPVLRPRPAIKGLRGKPGVRPATFPDQGALHLPLHLL